ncbi:autotransporter outer membrane beta-barrel domain-containing protein [[Haemophilus] felis]|nr:autotransporter outer membrane beta-barrel domain-containing protein [[Haemophilus] felis]
MEQVEGTNTLKLVADAGSQGDLRGKTISGFDDLVVDGVWALPDITTFIESISVATGALRLSNQGKLTAKNITNNANSRIVVASDYQIEGNLINRNEIAFESNGGRFKPNRLQVNGDYHAQGKARLNIRADIGASPVKIDRTSIDGKVRGTTLVQLVPAKDGALNHSLKEKEKIIETGHSDNNAFALAQNKFGKYRYRLAAATEENKVNWYLSTLTNATLGSVANALASTQEMFNVSYYDRHAAQAVRSSPLWLRVNHRYAKTALEQDPIAVQAKRQVFQLGYQAGHFATAHGQLNVGAHLNYGVENATARNLLEADYSQPNKLTGYGVTLYANWANPIFYADGWLSRQHFKLDAAGEETFSHKMKVWQASLELGYRHRLADTHYGSLWLEPQWQVRYHRLTAPIWDNTPFLGTENLLHRAGLRLSLLSATHRLQPYVEVNGLYQKNKNGVNVDGEHLYLAGQRTMEVKLGIQRWQVAKNFTLWTHATHQFARKYQNTAVNLGLQYAF